MFIKFSVLFFILHCTLAQKENHHWELAVATEDRIELLLSNGSLAGEPFDRFSEFTKLKALAFDNVRHQFVVSDMDQENDTIFTVQLTNETDITPIIEDLPDDVLGLAIDPINDTLYWTDYKNKTINYVHLNEVTYQPKNLFTFTDGSPHSVAVDVCHRYIYWTNSEYGQPTIERSRLDGTNREVLLKDDLHRPAGIAVDYKAQRLYWADVKEGIYFTIESTNLEGKEREVVHRGTHALPFGIAVNSEAIYWTDKLNNALWMISKYDTDKVPKRIRQFKDRPMGLIAKNVQITNLPECNQLSEAMAAYNKSVEMFKEETDSKAGEEVVCLNGGYLAVGDDLCHCLRGFTGKYCEITLCHNYCLHGTCHPSSLGYPQCRCSKGFNGNRCEKDICDGFCMNGGVCSRISKEGESPICNCQEGFSGNRCEISRNVCDVFCEKRHNDVLISEKEVVCRCVDGSAESVKSNYTSAPLLSKEEHPHFLDHFQDTAFLALCCLVLIMLVAIIILSVYSCSLRRRPRIKKRIIVNKNVTPLTYRPQPATEQCEITIENCCNMNICETPCFEPPKCIQNKNDDKKKLLSNMENGEDLY